MAAGLYRFQYFHNNFPWPEIGREPEFEQIFCKINKTGLAFGQPVDSYIQETIYNDVGGRLVAVNKGEFVHLAASVQQFISEYFFLSVKNRLPRNKDFHSITSAVIPNVRLSLF
ncbi:Uncharacterised protein [Mycobacteroides abscessus subsp. abscessus]|nr:Uncharacterised protein [Mycobacteroides abscessus subsp. abscessus]